MFLYRLNRSLVYTISRLNSLFDDYLNPTAFGKPAKDACLTILADSRLHLLPLESLSIASVFKGLVSRDYSVHILGNRTRDNMSEGKKSITNINGSSFKVTLLLSIKQ